VIFYSVLLITIVLLPFADYSKINSFMADSPAPNIIFLIFHALCTSVLPYIFLTLALLYAETGKVSILASGGEPIAAVVFGIIFYSEIPTLLMLIGLAITIAALAFLCMKSKVQL
jgi:drug/metabolite transporter (DMT)-like permease